MLENEILKEADVIKVRLIRWLQHHNDSDLVLGNEVLYSTRQRRADLLMIKNQLLYAFEIKSEKDKVDRLDEQLEDYLSTFDFVYLVSTQKIKRNLKQALPKMSDLFQLIIITFVCKKKQSVSSDIIRGI